MTDSTAKTNETAGSKCRATSPTRSVTAKAAKAFAPGSAPAWQHKDGSGFNVQLDCVPLDGRIALRVASENKE